MEIFLSAFVLSLIMWSAPGAVMTEALRRGLTRVPWSVLCIYLGSLVGDAFWAAVACISAGFLTQNLVAHLLLGVIETLVLFCLAGMTLKDVWIIGNPQARSIICQGDFTTGALLGLASPYTIAFWLSVNSMAIAANVSKTHTLYVFLFFLGFLLAALVWSLFFFLFTICGRRLAHRGFLRWMNLGCSFVLGYFGLSLLASTLQLLHV
ncbi:MAG: LysE family translocator [Ktedonobacteraceae bacterium]